MIIRIVKLPIKKENIPSFERLFESSRDQIRAFAGCNGLELLQDRYDPALFFTYSLWESEQALEAYRDSEFFRATWKKTKAFFRARAEAWSLVKAEEQNRNS